MLVDQLPKRVRLLEWIQIPPLDVFHQRHLQAGLRRCFLDHRRYARHACQLCRPPAPLTGNQLERAVAPLTDQHRLEQSVLADGLGQVFELLLVELGPRLQRVGQNRIDRYVAQSDRGSGNERAQAAPEAVLARATHRSNPRWISSWARSA